MVNVKCDMSNNSLDDIIKLLTPFVDITACDRTTLSKLNRNHKEIISKLNQTGRLLLLEVEGQTFLISNAKIYFDLERKRQCLLSQFKTVEEALQLGTVEGDIVKDPRIIELQDLERQIALSEADIAADLWKTEQGMKQLADLRTRATALTDDLKQSAAST